MSQNLALNQVSVAPQTAVQPYFPSENDWKMMLSWGTSALKSGMLPQAIKTAEAAAIIALKGRELGIPFMQAIAHVHVINGKPAMSAEMLQALARKNLPGLVMNIIESTNEKAVIEFIRPEKGSKPYTMAFSIEDAKRAELLSKSVWKQYPAAMLWSRAVSAGLRKVCPEALMGVSYTPEEMNVKLDAEGNPVQDKDGYVIETTGRKVENTQPVKENTQPESEKPQREVLYRQIMQIRPQIQKLYGPDCINEEMNRRWKHCDIMKATLEQIESLIDWMDDRVSSKKLEENLTKDAAPNEGAFKTPSPEKITRDDLLKLQEYAKTFGIHDSGPIKDFAKAEFGKTLNTLSISELLIINDAIRDGIIRANPAASKEKQENFNEMM